MKQADEIIDIGPADRAVFVGRTTSGKTTLAKVLLPQFPYVVAIDPKGTFSLPNGRITTNPEDFKRQQARPYEPLIYRPDEQYWTIDSYDEVFKTCYRRRNTRIYIDEVYGVVRGPNVPLYYRACITRGAELNIGVWSATQRPSRIPLEILTESEHYVLFPLQSEDDWDRMEEYMPGIEREGLTVKHSFYYHRIGDHRSEIYKLDLEGAQ